jgi:hypothetical protein
MLCCTLCSNRAENVPSLDGLCPPVGHFELKSIVFAISGRESVRDREAPDQILSSESMSCFTATDRVARPGKDFSRCWLVGNSIRGRDATDAESMSCDEFPSYHRS